jgi:hypothetical protein
VLNAKWRIGGAIKVFWNLHKSALRKQSLSFLSSGVQKVFVPKILRAEIARAAAELIFWLFPFSKTLAHIKDSIGLERYCLIMADSFSEA